MAAVFIAKILSKCSLLGPEGTTWPGGILLFSGSGGDDL
jgi:hypothetical protein